MRMINNERDKYCHWFRVIHRIATYSYGDTQNKSYNNSSNYPEHSGLGLLLKFH